MISKKALNQYNFSDLEQYFNYILESEINGQFEQVENLILALSKPQRIEFLDWLVLNQASKEAKSVFNKCVKLLKL